MATDRSDELPPRHAWARRNGDETGASLAEYALLVSLIAFVAAAAITNLGPIIRDMFQQLANGF